MQAPERRLVRLFRFALTTRSDFARADKDWYGLWKASDEFKVFQNEIDAYHAESHGKVSAADAAPDSELGYAAPIMTQLVLVTQRAFQHYWRDVDYLMGKIMLNIVGGEFRRSRHSSRADDRPQVSSSDSPSGTLPTTFLDCRRSCSRSS